MIILDKSDKSKSLSFTQQSSVATEPQMHQGPEDCCPPFCAGW